MLLCDVPDVLEELDAVLDSEAALVVNNLAPLGVDTSEVGHVLDQDVTRFRLLHNLTVLLPGAFLSEARDQLLKEVPHT